MRIGATVDQMFDDKKEKIKKRGRKSKNVPKPNDLAESLKHLDEIMKPIPLAQMYFAQLEPTKKLILQDLVKEKNAFSDRSKLNWMVQLKHINELKAMGILNSEGKCDYIVEEMG